MKTLFLFTDGSVNTVTKTGYGASLSVTDAEALPEEVRSQVMVKKFKNTSSTRLELETLLWALNEIKEQADKIVVYTDSQNIIKLEERRERLEKNSFRSAKNKPLKNADLYIEFYRLTDNLDCEFIKIEGHKASRRKNNIDMLFTLVDRESRRALRNKY
jgi:ribonuclease HI